MSKEQEYKEAIRNEMIEAGERFKSSLLKNSNLDIKLIANNDKADKNEIRTILDNIALISSVDIKSMIKCVDAVKEDTKYNKIECYFEYKPKKAARKVHANGALDIKTKSLTVLAGSEINSEITEDLEDTNNKVIKMRISEELIYVEEGIKKTTRDLVFKSPSAASMFITGRGDNGWTSWKLGESESIDKYR